MAEIRHLENRHDIIFFCWGWSDCDKISQTGAEWHVVCGDIVKIETKCRIPIWWTFPRRIPWHVIPEPPATLQGAATCEFNVTILELCVTLQGAATWWIHCHDSRGTCHIAWCNNSICRIENHVFRHILFFWFLMQFWLWRAAAFVSSPIHLFKWKFETI